VIERIADRLLARGAASVILGCSELPLVVQGRRSRYVDATEALARACVRTFNDLRGQHRA
jgi:aspartate/glutamate racemase